jgi:hypothetical protein
MHVVKTDYDNLPTDWSQPKVAMKTQKVPKTVSQALVPPSGKAAGSGVVVTAGASVSPPTEALPVARVADFSV